MSQHDQVLMRNFLAVLGALAVLAIVFYFIAGDLADEQAAGSDASIEKLVAANIQPVGKVRLDGDMAQSQMESTDTASMPVSAAPRSGEKIYNSTCVSCHSTGVAGAPKTGDKAAWAPRIARGLESIVQNATKGMGAMPPKGLCMDCSNEELSAAIEHMISASQ